MYSDVFGFVINGIGIYWIHGYVQLNFNIRIKWNEVGIDRLLILLRQL